MTPMPKGGDHTHVNNLRLITLLPIYGETLETNIHKRLMNHMDIDHIFSENQGGIEGSIQQLILGL